MTFILSEDKALRDMLKGIVVSDNANATRPVEVWFGQPDMEIRNQSYPFITIDLIDLSEATERLMSGARVTPWYYEDVMDIPPVADDWDMPYPIPMNLDYQVTSFARQPRHDRQILAQVIGQRLPMRFGSLEVVEREVSSDEFDVTIRRLDVLDVAKRDTVESGKRLFMNVWTVRISSEVPQAFVSKYYNRVTQVSIDRYAAKNPAAYPSSLTDPSLMETITITV